MRAEIRKSAGRAKEWARVAVPLVVESVWPGAEIWRVEDEAHPVCKQLDMSCGIDWIVEFRGLVKGLSVRCQAYTGFETFTVRAQRTGPGYSHESELGKALRAAASGAFTAQYQLHAYMSRDGQTVVAWGLAHRVELFRLIERGAPGVRTNRAHDPEARQWQEFKFVEFKLVPSPIMVRYERAPLRIAEPPVEYEASA